MLGQRRRRPAFARPPQPRTPKGRCHGHYLPGRRHYRLPGWRLLRPGRSWSPRQWGGICTDEARVTRPL